MTSIWDTCPWFGQPAGGMSEHRAGWQPLGLHCDWGAPGAQRAAGRDAQLHEAVHQILNWPLPHAWHAVQCELPSPGCSHGRCQGPAPSITADLTSKHHPSTRGPLQSGWSVARSAFLQAVIGRLQSPHGRASIPQEKLAPLGRESASTPMHHHLTALPLLFQSDSQGLQCTHHVSDVLAVLHVEE